MEVPQPAARITLTPVTMEDLGELWRVAYGSANTEWRRWNGPFLRHSAPSKAAFLAVSGPRDWVNAPLQRVIRYQGEIIGALSATYEDGDLKHWLEVGIVIYRQDLWGQGLGQAALTQWLTDLFSRFPDLPHIGLATWSGNERMMRLATRVGMQLEGRIRQVRFWQGRYYDSMKYGILRSEWSAQS